MLSRHFAGPLTLAFSLFLALGQAAVTPEAKAEEAGGPVEKVQKLNRYAVELFDDENFALAEKTLLEALGILQKANLAGAPASLATHGNLAILYSIGLRDPNKAVAAFRRALAIKPDLKLSKKRTAPETEANFERAKAEMAGPAAPPKLAAPPPKPAAPETAPSELEPARAGALRCPSGGEIQAGDDVTLKCLTSDAKTARVVLYYKANGSEDYQVAPMTKGEPSGSNASWIATIPGSDTNAKWVPMYFEAQNAAGAIVASSGRADSPNVITVKGAGAAGSGGGASAEGDEEEGEEEEAEEIDDNNPLARLENERRRESEGLRGTWTFALGLGSGVGYAVGGATEAFGKQNVQFNSGVAPAYLGHSVVEIGYFIGRKTALSLGGRFQRMPGMEYGAATGAISGLLRFLFFSDRDGRIRWYFSTVAGGGEGFRLRVKVGVIDQNTGNLTGQTVYDTVQGGPFLAGLGGGMVVKLTRRLHWTVDTQVLVGIPKPSTVLDLTTGIRLMH